MTFVPPSVPQPWQQTVPPSEPPSAGASPAAPPTEAEAGRSTDRRGNDTATAALVVIAVITFMAAFTWLGPVLRPFLIAVFLFYATRFGAKLLTKLGLGSTAAYASLLPCAAIFAILFGRLVYGEAEVFLAKWPKYETRITNFLNATKPARMIGLGRPRADDATDDRPVVLPADSAGNFFRVTSRSALDYVFRHGFDVVETFVLVFVYLIFLFVGGRKLPGRIERAFPGDQGRRLLLIGAGISTSMENFMAVKTIVGVGMGATAGLAMFLFGLDHWLLWSFLFFASNYITYIGSAVTVIPPIVLACFDFTSPLAAAALGAVLLVNRLVWIDIVEVRMSGRELNLDPTLMFLWLAYWGWVWGVVGLILAYPMMAALKIALAHVGSGGWAELLAGE
jgi:predicted PurR-regulated permease PerM